MDQPFAVTGFFYQNGLILAVSRKDNPNDFGLPGGKVDPGETPEEALVREIYEETGLRVIHYQHVFVARDAVYKDRYCSTYQILTWQGSIHTAESGVVQWVKPEVLTNPATASFHTYNVSLLAHLKEIGFFP